MKKTILLVSVCFMLLFVGCSKDDNSDTKVNNFINTKWEVTNDQGVYFSLEFITETEVKWTVDLPIFSPDYNFYNYTYLNNKATMIRKDTGEIIYVGTSNGNTMTLDSRSEVFNRVD